MRNLTKQECHPNRTVRGFNQRWKVKHDEAVGPTHGSYSDPLHTKALKEAGKNPGDVWRITTKPYKQAHFATFPPDLPERCIKAGCPKDGLVLDPFAGSGTTLAVALDLGRQALGIEISPKYIPLIERRCHAQEQGKLGVLDYKLISDA